MISNVDRIEDYAFVAVSDMGLNHRINDTPNQDAVMYEIMDEDFAIAVSDGVGSCSKAEIGSKAAVESVMQAFARMKKGDFKADSNSLVDEIIRNWKSRLGKNNIDDCCATLKAAIKIGSTVRLISIGDGLIAITSDGMSSCSPVDEAMFVNLTSCLNEKVKEEDFWVDSFSLDRYFPYVIFACTDGVSNGIEAGKEIDLIREIENHISKDALKEELENLLISISEYSSDDITIGVVKYERNNAKSIR